MDNDRNFRCWSCNYWRETSEAHRSRSGELICATCHGLDEIPKYIEKKKKVLTSFLCAAAALFLSYFIISFSLLELDVNKWKQSDRDTSLILSAGCFFVLALWNKLFKVDLT